MPMRVAAGDHAAIVRPLPSGVAKAKYSADDSSMFARRDYAPDRA